MHAASETTAPRGQVALVVEDNPENSRDLAIALRHSNLRVLECGGNDALKLLGSQQIDVVLAGQYLKDGSGIELLERVRSRWPEVRRALVTDRVDMAGMCDAVNRAGVSYLLSRPLDASSIERIRREVLDAASPARSAPAPKSVSGASGAQYGIIGQSPAIRALVDLIDKIARTDSTVLVNGETGTGKELVGHAIHQASHRSTHVFSAINSAALPETLLESELFGHRRGAFTGASANRRGLFEHADGGTVFLDELGEMPLSMQAKLLRFLQTGEVRPVGGETARIVNVRLVSATNKDLDTEVEAGRFREDLYYRLAVIPITVPPLRDRGEDIPLLANHFLCGNSSDEALRCAEIDRDAMDALQRHDWPGNVRELQNVIERGVALCSGNRIRLGDLPARILAPRRNDAALGIQSLPGVERRHILETLEKVGWNRKRAASLLQISTTTLWRRLKEFGIDDANARRAYDESISASR